MLKLPIFSYLRGFENHVVMHEEVKDLLQTYQILGSPSDISSV